MLRLVASALVWLAAVSTARADAPVILVFGDSISAGYGLPAVRQGWVALLKDRLERQGYGYAVVNASVSGETTEGGLARLPRALALHRPRLVILELGGNDGLRALPIAAMRYDLERMIDLSRAAGAQVLLLGMRIPPNYGPEYSSQFAAVYADLAKSLHVPTVSFLLEGVALNVDLMQADGIHPDQAGQPHLLDNVWPALEPLLGREAQPPGH